MGFSTHIGSARWLKAAFSLCAIIPLLAFMVWMNNGFPRPFAGSYLLGVPVSIVALLALMFFQVALTWCYLKCFSEDGGAKP